MLVRNGHLGCLHGSNGRGQGPVVGASSVPGAVLSTAHALMCYSPDTCEVSGLGRIGGSLQVSQPAAGRAEV